MLNCGVIIGGGGAVAATGGLADAGSGTGAGGAVDDTGGGSGGAKVVGAGSGAWPGTGKGEPRSRAALGGGVNGR